MAKLDGVMLRGLVHHPDQLLSVTRRSFEMYDQKNQTGEGSQDLEVIDLLQQYVEDPGDPYQLIADLLNFTSNALPPAVIYVVLLMIDKVDEPEKQAWLVNWARSQMIKIHHRIWWSEEVTT